MLLRLNFHIKHIYIIYQSFLRQHYYYYSWEIQATPLHYNTICQNNLFCFLISSGIQAALPHRLSNYIITLLFMKFCSDGRFSPLHRISYQYTLSFSTISMEIQATPVYHLSVFYSIYSRFLNWLLHSTSF